MYRHNKAKNDTLLPIKKDEVAYVETFIDWLLKKYRVLDRKRYKVLRKGCNDITEKARNE